MNANRDRGREKDEIVAQWLHAFGWSTPAIICELLKIQNPGQLYRMEKNGLVRRLPVTTRGAPKTSVFALSKEGAAFYGHQMAEPKFDQYWHDMIVQRVAAMAIRHGDLGRMELVSTELMARREAHRKLPLHDAVLRDSHGDLFAIECERGRKKPHELATLAQRPAKNVLVIVVSPSETLLSWIDRNTQQTAKWFKTQSGEWRRHPDVPFHMRSDLWRFLAVDEYGYTSPGSIELTFL